MTIKLFHFRYIEVPSGHHVELTITDFEVISLLFHQSSSFVLLMVNIAKFQTESCCDRLYITWDICQYGYWSYYKYYKGYQYTPVKLQMKNRLSTFSHQITISSSPGQIGANLRCSMIFENSFHLFPRFFSPRLLGFSTPRTFTLYLFSRIFSPCLPGCTRMEVSRKKAGASIGGQFQIDRHQ